MGQFSNWTLSKRHGLGRIILAISVLLLVMNLSAPIANAMSDKDYIAALKMAENSVLKDRARQSQANALSSTLIKGLLGRYYEVGDTWDVAVTRVSLPIMRMHGDTNTIQQEEKIPGIFRYEVKEVKTGFSPEVVIEVTEITDQSTHGTMPVDSRVEKLVLTLSDILRQTKKAYHFRGVPEPILVSPDAIRGRSTALELLPLDAPDISLGDRSRPTTLPKLPKIFSRWSDQIRFKPNLNRSSWFEINDFFGRPVQVLWQQGDLWPSYMKSPSGVAVLIRKGART